MAKDIDEKILDAARKVVSREKISGTRMRMIAKEANMSQSNLHYYFPTKNDLMIAILDKIQEEFLEDRKNYINLEDKTIEENVSGFFEQKKNEILHNKEIDCLQFDYWVQGTVNEEVREKFQNTFNLWRNNINRVLNKSEVNESKRTMIPFIMISLMIGASMQYLIDEGKFDLEEYFDIVKKIIFD
ncbi:TetR/AcrR family transcriptional regulator [Clostridium thailandense]|uniref:TetR/AcrR family transcriptional regulator n=1 Tax=Clostridium thailandense TaxID=2794346 RepID=A0A949TM74_9CLOT|nr:TetR/AcrR family transcriptional regulator [Clostridium thailandense]MBV7274935.1 TetR/AcrR family transcriptional regulator [Clostridium thailandense]